MRHESDRIELVCRHCSERNPPNFEICWNCAKTLEDAEKETNSELHEVDEELLKERIAPAPILGRWTEWGELIALLLIGWYPSKRK